MGTKNQQLQRAGIGRARAVAWALPAIAQWQRQCIAAGDGDPTVVPEPSFRFCRLTEVKQLTGLSKSSIYRLISENRFPAPVPLSGVAT